MYIDIRGEKLLLGFRGYVNAALLYHLFLLKFERNFEPIKRFR